MKHYNKYEVEDFAGDDDFINWCLQPSEESENKWQNWIDENPTKFSIIQEARALILDLYAIEQEENAINFEQEIWENIEVKISEKSTKTKIRKLYWQISAAAAVFVLISSIYFLNKKSAINHSDSVSSDWVNFENNSGLTKEIKLADNSMVILEPFSTLKYPKNFSGDERAVFLKGEAFFDIERDTLKPFMVYANETITKVLGTSFRIIAFEGQKTIEVEVKTGKVAVYANVDSGENQQKKRMVFEADEQILVPIPNKKLEVTPNQKVVFDRKAEEMIRTITSLPQIIKKVSKLPEFEFQNESVIKVFEALELAYGIDINFNKSHLKNCTIKTKLDDEPLFDKLNIICTALNLKFEEKDATIFIKGEGCS